MFAEYYFFFYHGKHDLNPAAFPDEKQNFELAGEDRNCIDGLINSEELSVKDDYFYKLLFNSLTSYLF